MAEERRDQERPTIEDADTSKPGEAEPALHAEGEAAERKMKDVTSPDAKTASQEVAAFEALETGAEEEAGERPSAEQADGERAEPEAGEEQARREEEGEGEEGVGEEVREAGETLVEAPGEWAEEATTTVEDAVSAAEEDIEATAPEEDRDTEGGRSESKHSESSPPTQTQSRGQATLGTATRPGAEREPQKRPSRRTLAREERRQRSTAKRRRRRLLFGVLGGTVAAMLILGLVLQDPSITPLSQQEPQGPVEEPAARVGQETDVQEGGIIEPGAEHADYEFTPPTSGPRYEEGAPWGIHEEAVADEAVVRNLEQGGIVVNHNLADEAAVQELREFVEGQAGFPSCFIMRPYEDLSEGSVVLTAWGWRQEFEGVGPAAKQEFIDGHINLGPLFLGPRCGREEN